MPKFSVQICCYNSEKYLKQAIESVAAQTFSDWELVIVNDGSNDATEDIVKGFMKKGLPTTYFFQKNKGFASARNKALELSKGEWVAILDHDDIWYPDKLAAQDASIREHPRVRLHFSNSEWFTDDGKVLRKTIEDKGFLPGIIKDPFMRLLGGGCFIDSETVAAYRNTLMDLGGFNERYKYIVDYDMFLRVARRCDICYDGKVLAGWRMHPSQATKTMEDAIAKEYIELFEWVLREDALPADIKNKVKRSMLYHIHNYSLARLRKEGPKAFLWTVMRGIKTRPFHPRTYLKTVHTFYRAARLRDVKT